MSACPIASGGRGVNPAIAELAGINRWVLWKLERSKAGKLTKVPYCVGGRRKAKSTDPRSWDTFDAAWRSAFVDGAADGIGVVVDWSDDIMGADLDKCILEDGTVEPWAHDVVATLDSYTEASPSGRGLRVLFRSPQGGDWGLNEKGAPLGGRKVGRLELYRAERYLTVTGGHMAGTPDTINQVAPEVIAGLLGAAASGPTRPNGHDQHAHAQEDLDDIPPVTAELRERLKEAMARDPKVRAAWDGAPPDRNDKSRSAYDLKLAGALRRHGGFSLEDFAALAYRWPHGKGRDGDPRHYRRTWTKAEPDQAAPGLEQDLQRLARLSATDYDQARKAEAKHLGLRTATLDAEVARRRPRPASEPSEGQGRSLELPTIEPWPDPVDGAELLDGLVRQIQRFVVLPDGAAAAVALWIQHTHAYDAAFHAPRLTLISPVKRCGKSSLLRCIARLVPRPIATSNISPAAIYRVIEAAAPTLLVDEMDARGDREKVEEIRGIIDSSHCRLDARVIRIVPVADGMEVRAFSTWAPIALAYIKGCPDTIRDRSVVVVMARKGLDQAVERMRLDQDQGFTELVRKAARWAADHLAELRRADPDVPRELNDRAADNWRCLLAIADAAGGHWPATARKAARALSADDDDDALGIELLRDIKSVFDMLDHNGRLSSDAIVAHLTGMEGRPWAEFGKSGKPLSKHQLARLLKAFKLAPGTVKLKDGSTPKGYKRESFADLWERYLQSDTSPPPKESAAHSDFQNDTFESEVADRNRPKAAESADGGEVSVEKPGSARFENDSGASWSAWSHPDDEP